MPSRRASSEGSSGGSEERGQRKGFDGRALGGREESLLDEIELKPGLWGLIGLGGEAGVGRDDDSGLNSVAWEMLWLSLVGRVEEDACKLIELRWWLFLFGLSLARWKVLWL